MTLAETLSEWVMGMPRDTIAVMKALLFNVQMQHFQHKHKRRIHQTEKTNVATLVQNISIITSLNQVFPIHCWTIYFVILFDGFSNQRDSSFDNQVIRHFSIIPKKKFIRPYIFPYFLTVPEKYVFSFISHNLSSSTFS